MQVGISYLKEISQYFTCKTLHIDTAILEMKTCLKSDKPYQSLDNNVTTISATPDKNRMHLNVQCTWSLCWDNIWPYLCICLHWAFLISDFPSVPLQTGWEPDFPHTIPQYYRTYCVIDIDLHIFEIMITIKWSTINAKHELTIGGGNFLSIHGWTLSIPASCCG